MQNLLKLKTERFCDNMYLHIGKDICLDERKIIGIFNIEAISKNKEYNAMYENIKNDIIDISDGVKKTLILINDKKIKGYVTNISSATLKKREI